MAENILLICGSLNQTMIMHHIARKLSDHNCYFTPFYADGFLAAASRAGLADFTILGGRHRKATEAYLKDEAMPVDFGGRDRDYDAVITGTDLIVQNNVRGKRLILVQEGMTEEENYLYHLVRFLKLPRFIANTAATGISDAYDVFCVASQGYRDLFIKKGVRSEKIVVTGIPNYDNAGQYVHNNFPYHGYALVATSSIRETKKFDDRDVFLKQVRQIAGSKRIIFKLHPNEDISRARKEIRRYFPGELIFIDGNVHHMIANCDILIAQSSSVIYTGLALGKEVHSSLDHARLRELLPIQNGGKSAERIADICRQLLLMPLIKEQRKAGRARLIPKWEA
jgi:hypothetical protein